MNRWRPVRKRDVTFVPVNGNCRIFVFWLFGDHVHLIDEIRSMRIKIDLLKGYKIGPNCIQEWYGIFHIVLEKKLFFPYGFVVGHSREVSDIIGHDCKGMLIFREIVIYICKGFDFRVFWSGNRSRACPEEKKTKDKIRIQKKITKSFSVFLRILFFQIFY